MSPLRIPAMLPVISATLPRGKVPSRDLRWIDADWFGSALDTLHKRGVRYISFFGGETLLHPAECDGDHHSTPYQPTFQQAVVQFFEGQWRLRGCMRLPQNLSFSTEKAKTSGR
jgi:hypothetical protein